MEPVTPGDMYGKHWVIGTVHGRGSGRLPASCLTRLTPPPIRCSFQSGDEMYVAGDGYIGRDPAQDLSFSKGELLIRRTESADLF